MPEQRRAGLKKRRLVTDETWVEVGESLWREVHKRIRNPKRASLISDTVLFKTFIEFAKVEARRGFSSQGSRVTNVLNFLAGAEGLPKERQIRLLVEAVRRAEAAGLDAGPLHAALGDLVGEEAAGKLLAIEG